jgi:protein arginine phosphatase
VREILVVCQANTARSIMAHVMLERLLDARGVTGVRVSSAGVGLYARDGMLPSLDARIVLRELDIHVAEDALASTDLRQHPALVARADVILTMTAAQRETLRGFAQLDGQPVLTLRELAGEHGDIADPAAQGEEAFRTARDEIARCLGLGIDRLVAMLG